MLSTILSNLSKARAKQLYAIANLVINPVALWFWFYPPSEEIAWLIMGWIVLSSLANGLAKGIVYQGIVTLWDFGINGLEHFGFVGLIVVAILFGLVGFWTLAGVLVILWLYAVYLLLPN